jgi:hypothetical protein
MSITQGRDKNSRFVAKGERALEPAGIAESVLVFEEHRKQLASLKAEHERLVTLTQRSEELFQAQSHTAQAIEAVAEKLLGDRSNGNAGPTVSEAEEELSQLEKRRLSLSAQLNSLSAKQRKAEEALQKRLGADITASGRLESAWLEHVIEREANVLLETAAFGKSGSPEVTAAARVLANAGKVYAETFASLGATVPVTYLWTRPLEPAQSEKSAHSQTILAHDPMYAPPKRADTVNALLDAANGQVARWETLLGQIEGSLKVFALPGYTAGETETKQSGISGALEWRDLHRARIETLK